MAIEIAYKFKFGDGTAKNFNIRLDEGNLGFINDSGGYKDLPWTALGYNKCENCPLDDGTITHCPVALNLAGIVVEFKDFFAYENVNVTVTTAERIYMKDTTIQEGLGALIGIVMTTSGCPVMEKLKPMVRFHLPFASLTETIFRMVSMYLMGQFYLLKDGRQTNWDLSGLEAIYEEVGTVNRGFAIRLRDAAKKDANVNALVNLDCFATMVTLKAESTIEEIKNYFTAYLK